MSLFLFHLIVRSMWHSFAACLTGREYLEIQLHSENQLIQNMDFKNLNAA